MILTKSSMTPGEFEIGFDLTSPTTGNYWVDWAINFIDYCINILGLEVEAGPGTSIGVIQTAYGPFRYQFDCDWTQKDGRVSGFDYQERGFTLWEGIEIWNRENYSNGIDIANKRFDFIIWFTSECTDTREDRQGERIGLRFKYPLSNERGQKTAYYVSPAPSCQPWFKKHTQRNFIKLNYGLSKTDEGPYRNQSVPITGDTENAQLQVICLNDTPTDCGLLTKSINKELNYPWERYKEIVASNDNYYKQYTDLFDVISIARPEVSRGKALNNFHYIISKNLNTVNLKIKNNLGEAVLDIIYGNFSPEEVGGNSISNSFIMVSTGTTQQYMANFLVTFDGCTINSKKQVNRPSTQSEQHSYWGISRLLLDKQYIYCSELYQVFSFSEIFNDIDVTTKDFIDKEGNEHRFKLINYGSSGSETQRLYCSALALPI